jgi:spermidine/putrescine transport system substrate-binding protein
MKLKPLMETTKFEDLVCSGRLSRRQAHRVMASFGVGALTVSTLGNSAAASPEDQPIFFTWAGYDTPEFMQVYVAQHGEPPRYALFGDEDEAFNKMRAGFEPDVTYPCGISLKLWYDAGLLAPIDTGLIPNWQYVLDAFKNAPHSVVDGERVYVPEDWGQTSMIIRTDIAPEYKDPENQTWTALWNEKYAGRMTISDYSYEAFTIAALVLGFDPANMTPEQIEKCADLLKTQIPLDRMFTTSSTQLSQALASSELVIATGENALVAQLVEQTEGMDIEWTWTAPKEGALTWHCGLCIHPAAMEHGMYEKAHDVINSMISEESGVYEIGEWYYGHSNSLAYDHFDEEFLRSIGLAKDVNAALEGTAYVQSMNSPELMASKWEEIKAGF